MISTELRGGLGNYLFQIAAIHSLAVDNNDIAVFNLETTLVRHRPVESYLNNILRNIRISTPVTEKVYDEPHFTYTVLPYIKNCLYLGYFQCEKYFKHNRQSILNLFSITDELNIYITNKYSDILNKNTCAIHVRRADFLLAHHLQHHPVCTLEYYNEAIKQFPDVELFIFISDDILWCKENFKGTQYTFIEGEEDITDLYIMSKCKHNIIANSSFSWWGAWLNNNENKRMAAPKTWFGPAKKYDWRDVYPEKCLVI